MDIYILRHAIAEQRGTPGFERDSDRPLTAKGERKMRKIAEGMHAMELAFDLILSSPILRAKQTAEIVAKVFNAGSILEFSDALAVGSEPAQVISELKKWRHPLRSVLLVGHEPYLSTLISTLISGDGDLSITMKKGGLCKLTIDSLEDGRHATLEWLLAPNHLARID
jgi:phosphohistidine phosphatase